MLAFPVGAQAASSQHYQVNEYQFGNGSQSAEKTCQDAKANNRQYCAREALGATTVGHAASQNYQLYGGFNTANKPLLELVVNGGTYDLGILNASTTHSKTATFTVRNYLSNDYAVELAGKTPATSGYHLRPIQGRDHSNQSPTASQPGLEQFGINLADNSTPDIGAVPDNNLPAGQGNTNFGYGYATSNYSSPDYYMFKSGDIIARSDKSSGTTKYTISIVANISNDTPAGYYGGTLDLIVIPKF